MWFARWVLIKYMGSTPVTATKVLPPRRPTDRHHAISTSATHDALRRVPLAVALQSCAAAAAITPSPSLLAGSRARLRSILGGAMAGLVDAAVDHDGPGDPRGLVGDRDRRLLGRHAGEQLRDPGMLVRAFLRLAYNGHRAVDEQCAQIAITLLGEPLLLDLAAGRIVLRHEANPRRQVPAILEQRRVGHPGPERTG